MAELARNLTRVNAIAMVAGTIIGASIFVQPSEIAHHLDSSTQVMAVWLACGVLTLFGALVCAELASAFPQTGGLYVFLLPPRQLLAAGRLPLGLGDVLDDALGDHRGNHPYEAALGMGMVVIGAPIYYWRHAHR